MTLGDVRVAALVPAAGLGVRLGLGPKALLTVGGRSLLSWAVDALSPHVDEVVVALPAALGGTPLPEASPRHDGRLPVVRSIEGGISRQETVMRLLASTDAAYVVVHDAARPLTPSDVVGRVLEAAVEGGAATAGLPLVDTLHDVATDQPLSREGRVSIQTPQAFERTLLMRAHEVATERGSTATDDAQLVRSIGGRVTIVSGSPWSHKLTHPSDVAWLEGLADVLRGRSRRGPVTDAVEARGER